MITGANGGIGQALCTAFNEAGYRIIATDRQIDAECNCDQYIQADLFDLVKDRQLLDDFVQRSQSKLTGLDVLVNNAAVQVLSSLDTLNVEDFRYSLDINVTATLVLTQAFQRLLIDSKGSVVNIGSIHASLTKPAFISYATSKTALRGLTKALAVDLGGKIRVNCIEPAAINTAMMIDGFKETPEKLSELAACHPTGKIGQPGDIARTAVFLANPDNEFMTGTILAVNGGIANRLYDPV